MIEWAECTDTNVFPNGDSSLPSAVTVLPGVIDRTQNVIIGHGALDMVLFVFSVVLLLLELPTTFFCSPLN